LKLCFGDYDREIALVAESAVSENQQAEILAVGSFSKAHLLNEAELALLVTDEYQGRGLGGELARRLIEIARFEKLERVTVNILHAALESRLALPRLHWRPAESGARNALAGGVSFHGSITIGIQIAHKCRK
jgi:acetyltransferase